MTRATTGIYQVSSGGPDRPGQWSSGQWHPAAHAQQRGAAPNTSAWYSTTYLAYAAPETMATRFALATLHATAAPAAAPDTSAWYSATYLRLAPAIPIFALVRHTIWTAAKVPNNRGCETPECLNSSTCGRVGC